MKRKTFENSSDNFIVNNKGGQAYPMLIYRIVQDYIGKVSSISKKPLISFDIHLQVHY